VHASCRVIDSPAASSPDVLIFACVGPGTQSPSLFKYEQPVQKPLGGLCLSEILLNLVTHLRQQISF